MPIVVLSTTMNMVLHANIKSTIPQGQKETSHKEVINDCLSLLGNKKRVIHKYTERKKVRLIQVRNNTVASYAEKVLKAA